MKRTRISLDAIADLSNLTLALVKSAKGKRHRHSVIRFMRNGENNLNQLGSDIRAGKLPYGRFRRFTIHDPKNRLIHAACFEDRIFHHAVMNLAGPVLERAMLPTSFACRPDMGVHRAAKWAQQSVRKYQWYGKIDIASYFATINHDLLMPVLMRRFKGAEFAQQLQRLLACHHSQTRRGLPIGSLTSQYFANYYLDGLDRLLNDLKVVKAHVRYMDDIVWWCDEKQQVKQVLAIVREYLGKQRDLVIKPTVQIQRSAQGILYCGYRILPGAMRLSIRRKRRYQQRRLYWEQQYLLGNITATQLQSAYASVHSILQGTDSIAWRKRNFCVHPPISV